MGVMQINDPIHGAILLLRGEVGDLPPEVARRAADLIQQLQETAVWREHDRRRMLDEGTRQDAPRMQRELEHAHTIAANAKWQNDRLVKTIKALADAAEMLWVVLANVSGGDWGKQTPEWQDAAARWRDHYFSVLKEQKDGATDRNQTLESGEAGGGESVGRLSDHPADLPPGEGGRHPEPDRGADR